MFSRAHRSSALKRFCCGWAAFGLALTLLGPLSSSAQSKGAQPTEGAQPREAQPRDVSGSFFVKFGVGLSDYTGDFPAQNVGHPLDFQEFIRGTGVPFANTSELGYQHSRALAVVLGLQVGNYPIVGYAGDTGLKDSYRYTLQLLGRYTFDTPDWGVSPYVDAGANVTFSGLKTGYGPSVGGGVRFPFNSSVSFFVESRFNFTYPDDAIDGNDNSPNGSSTGPFDSLNQLLGFGLKVNFGGFSDDDAPPVPDPVVSESDQKAGDRQKIDRQKASDPASDQRSRPDTSRYEGAVLVPSGTFIMGNTGPDPLSLQNAGRKRVTVSPVYVDQHEVSNAEYRNYLRRLSPSERKERLPDSTAWNQARTQTSWETYFRSDYYADYPVVAVTWNEARAYCEAQGKRLPTEAEWEYAARGGYIGRIYPWEGLSTRDQNGDYRANYNPPQGYSADGYAFTAPVESFPQNGWGLHNMVGNVAEWTQDAYTPSYDNLSDFNPRRRDEDEPRRVVRGGAWNSRTAFIGVGMRDTQPKGEASVDTGFRCVGDVARLKRENVARDTRADGTEGRE